MINKLVILMIVVALLVLTASVALANNPPGDPVGGCPNNNWTLIVKPSGVDPAIDQNGDGWICAKKNIYNNEKFFIDNKY